MKTPVAKKLASGRWRVQVTIDGIRYSVTRDTKQEAEKVATLMKLSPTQRAQKITYREAIDSYIEKYSKSLSPSTVKGYRDIQRTRFQSIMDFPINADIDMQLVINAEDVAPKTLKNAYGLICAVMRDLNLEPQKVRFPAAVKKERPYLDPDQIKVFLKVIEGDMYELPYLLCLHSLRRSEMLALKKSQVKDGVIHVSGSIVLGEDGLTYKPTNKTKSSARSIPIFIPRTAQLIEESPDGFLCPYPVKGMENHLRTILRKSGLPVSGFHMLRHSFATFCYSAGGGVSELTAMKLGGWSDYRVLREIYTHLAERQEREDIEKLKSALL